MGKTKVHELVGVEVDEKFKVELWGSDEFSISEKGTLWVDTGETVKEAYSSFLAALIIGREKIIRFIKPTDEQLKILKALDVLGIKYIAKDKDGSIYEYVMEPKRHSFNWFSDDETYEIPQNDKLSTLLPDWTVPLNIKEVLG